MAVSDRINKRRDHLANERTFLSWIRTAIGMMAFGFVVEKFSFFMRYIEYVSGMEGRRISHMYSAFFGIILVAVGTVLSILGFIRYRRTAKRIEAEDGRMPSLYLTTTLAVLASLIGVLLILYLSYSAR